MILSLRRALTALQIENEHLRALTNVKKSKEFPNFPEMVEPVDGNKIFLIFLKKIEMRFFD